MCGTIQQRKTRMPDKGDATDAFSSELEQVDGVILFDGHCAFCRNVVGHLLQVCSGDDLRVCSIRSARGEAAARTMGWDPPSAFALLTRSGIYLGVEAYIQILLLGSRSAWLGKLIATTPSSLSGGVYHWVATHRPFLSSLFGRGSHDAIPPDRYVAGGV
jgi:predicted DCC family thiol-disulfide oxidoreductase YuxK